MPDLPDRISIYFLELFLNKMKTKLLTLILIVFIFPLQAQISTGEVPYGIRYDLSQMELNPYVIVPEINVLSLKMHQASKDPDFAGFSVSASIPFYQHAEKVILHPDTTIWRLKITVPDAPDLGLVFSEFHLPENAKLFIYEDHTSKHIGAFTSTNNHPSGYLSTQGLASSSLILEYFQPLYTPEPTFIIEELIYLVNSPYQQTLSMLTSDPCHVNINCPEGQEWQLQKRGVARILIREGASWYLCTGSLINNTLNDGTPYLLTSDHCGENSTADDLLVWQFMFNYEYPGCVNQIANPSTLHTLSGSTLVAKGPLSGGTDFKLLRLISSPPGFWNVYYNGWSRRTGFPSSGVGIHHPAGDVKKISTYNTHLNNATYTGGMFNAFWRVIWAATESGHGITQGGSSGSPLFENNGLIIGTLTGGSASCSSPTSADIYGKFSRHWDANGSQPQNRLRDWLDPINSNPTLIYGYDPVTATNLVITSVSPANTGTVTGSGYYAAGEQVTLTATPANNYIFVNWTNENLEPVSTNQQYTFTMPADEISFTANFQLGTDTGKIVVGENIFIFPNPADDYINIRSQFFGDSLSYTLYNLNGQKIRENLLIKNQDYIWPISLQDIPGGIYFIRMKLGGLIDTQKIVVLK
jgi:uncharacterized repeat protein (TIGR02543 family)